MNDFYRQEGSKDRVHYIETNFDVSDPMHMLCEEKESRSGKKYRVQEEGLERKWCLPGPEADYCKSINDTKKTKKERDSCVVGNATSEGENKNVSGRRTNTEPFALFGMQVDKKESANCSDTRVPQKMGGLCRSNTTLALVEKYFSVRSAAQISNERHKQEEDSELPVSPCISRVAVEAKSPLAVTHSLVIPRSYISSTSPRDALQASVPVPSLATKGEPVPSIPNDNAIISGCGDTMDSGAVWQLPQLRDFEFSPTELLDATRQTVVAPAPVPVDNACREERSHWLSDTLPHSPNESKQGHQPPDELSELWEKVENGWRTIASPQSCREPPHLTLELQELLDASVCPRTRAADVVHQGKQSEPIHTSYFFPAKRGPGSRSVHTAGRAVKAVPQSTEATGPSTAALRKVKSQIAAQHAPLSASSIPKQTRNHPTWRVPERKGRGAKKSEQHVARWSVPVAARAKPVFTPYTESYSCVPREEANRKRMNAGGPEISGSGKGSTRTCTASDGDGITGPTTSDGIPISSDGIAVCSAKAQEPEADPAPLASYPPRQTPLFAARSTFVRAARRPHLLLSPATPSPRSDGAAETVSAPLSARRCSENSVHDISDHPPSSRAPTQAPSLTSAPSVWSIPPPRTRLARKSSHRLTAPVQAKGLAEEQRCEVIAEQGRPQIITEPRRLNEKFTAAALPSPSRERPMPLHETAPRQEIRSASDSPVAALSRAESVRSILRKSRPPPAGRAAEAPCGLRPEEKLLQRALCERQAQLRSRAAELKQQMETWDAQQGAAASKELRGALELVQSRRRLHAREWEKVEGLCWDVFASELLRGAKDPMSIVMLPPPWHTYHE